MDKSITVAGGAVVRQVRAGEWGLKMASYRLGIVGEANYQAAIAKVQAGQAVTIEHEPDNPFDPRAVRVSADGATIGYAPRDGWITRALLDEGRAISARIDQITGGIPESPAKGIVLAITLDGEEAPLQHRPLPKAAPAQFAAGLARGAARPEPSTKKSGSAGITIVAVIVGVILVAQCAKTAPSADDAAASAEAANPTLPAATVANCRNLIATGMKTRIIRARPSSNRINVDERQWAEMEATLKDATLKAVSCDLWQRWTPPAGQYVVAYGYRSGKRIQMLTEVGMARE